MCLKLKADFNDIERSYTETAEHQKSPGEARWEMFVP